MRRAVLLLSLLLPASAQPLRYRQWVNGREAGGRSEEILQTPEGPRHKRLEWLEVDRGGAKARQEVETEVLRTPSGAFEFRWRLRLAKDWLEGTGTGTRERVELQPRNGEVQGLAVPSGALVWPADLDTRLREAAAQGSDLRLTQLSLPDRAWITWELRHHGPAPLPGHPSAVRFSGWEGDAALTLWVDPQAGLLREHSREGALEVVTQREHLPPPPASLTSPAHRLASTLNLPPHAFLPWLSALELHQTAGSPMPLREDAQARSLGPGAWQLRRALAADPTELPVSGPAAPEDAPYLRPTPLLPFRDARFDGLLKRLAPRPGANRWELCRAVTRFVFDWIEEDDEAPGFASALEVARRAKGDCTEHAVLAVALLRRLGVPARGVLGWAALDRELRPHFWAEARIGGRWIPFDPAWDQAPASSFRLKVMDTDLADLGGVGWEAAEAFAQARLKPHWPGPRISGDRLVTPSGETWRHAGGRWRWIAGTLLLELPAARLQLRALPHPKGLAKARPMQAPGGLKGWWTVSGSLVLEIPENRWVQVDGLDEEGAFGFLANLKIEN